MSPIASQITGVSIIAQQFVQAQIKEDSKTPGHWHLWGKSTGDRWFPSQRANKAGNVSFYDVIMSDGSG